MGYGIQPLQMPSYPRHKKETSYSYPVHLYYQREVLHESVSSSKYLGVDISNNLTWDERINRSTKNTNQTLGFLRRNTKVKSEPIKSIAYPSEIWSPHTQTRIDQFLSFQRRTARWMKSDYGHTFSVTNLWT